MKTLEEIVAFINECTNINQAQILNVLAPRISVFVGTVPTVGAKGYCVSGELSQESPVSMNGADFQLNMGYVDLPDSDAHSLTSVLERNHLVTLEDLDDPEIDEGYFCGKGAQ